MKKSKKHIIIDIIFILIYAIYWESISTEFWIYDRRIYGYFIFNRFPLSLLVFWAFVFFISLYISETLYKKLTKKTEIPLFDKKLYLLDIIAFGLMGTILEALTYRWNWFEYGVNLHWTFVPIINLPINAIMGYFGIGALIPTTVRFYRSKVCK